MTSRWAAGLLVRVGVTGHGTRIASAHLASLERFPFDSVLLPYNYLNDRQWQTIYRKAGLVPASQQHQLGIYPPPFGWIFDRRLHFMALLVAREGMFVTGGHQIMANFALGSLGESIRVGS